MLNDEQEATLQAHFERMTRELAWMRKAMVEADMRDEYLSLMEAHFDVLKRFGVLMIELVRAMSTEDFEKYREQLDPIFAAMKELTPHSDKFRSIYDRLPSRFDTFLATVDTPPHKM